MQPYQRARLAISGRPPGLILHTSELADETNEYAIAIQELVDKGRGRNKLTAEQRERKDLLQWRGALGTQYTDGKRIMVPANNLFRATVIAARDFSLGSKIEERGAVTFEQPELLIEHDGPTNLDALYKDERYRLRVPVNMNPSKRGGGSLIPVTRPVFPVWKTSVNCLVLTEIIDWEKFCQVMELAGNVGIGNGRKIGYGRFSVEIERL